MLTTTGVRYTDLLFRAHHKWLDKWLRRRPHAGVSPEDVVSEVFLRIMSLANPEELREPRAMMTIMARRILTELRRRNNLWKSYEADLLAMPEGIMPSPEEQAIILESLRLVDRMLSTLTPVARAVFLYSRVDGLKQEEIATKLGISTRRVRRYLTQGLELAYAHKAGLL